MCNINICYQSHPNWNHIPEIPIMAFVLELLCLLGIHVHCYFLRMPENVAGRIGEVVAMNCASNDTTTPCGNLVWTRYDPKTSDQTDISKPDQLSELVSKYIAFTDSSNGNCNLNITIRESAEGTYECFESATEKSTTAQLIVLEDDPECLVRTGDKVFNITCSVSFLGLWAPTMKWLQVNGTNSIPINASESIIPGQIVSSTVLLNRVNVSDERVRKTVGFQCSVNFSEDRRPDKTSATNVPAYEWASPIFGGGDKEQLDDTSNDRPDNNVACVATIATLVVVIVVGSAACAFARCTGRLKISRRQDGRQDVQRI